jgi:hypothetical protein
MTALTALLHFTDTSYILARIRIPLEAAAAREADLDTPG